MGTSCLELHMANLLSFMPTFMKPMLPTITEYAYEEKDGCFIRCGLPEKLGKLISFIPYDYMSDNEHTVKSDTHIVHDHFKDIYTITLDSHRYAECMRRLSDNSPVDYHSLPRHISGNLIEYYQSVCMLYKWHKTKKILVNLTTDTTLFDQGNFGLICALHYSREYNSIYLYVSNEIDESDKKTVTLSEDKARIIKNPIVSCVFRLDLKTDTFGLCTYDKVKTLNYDPIHIPGIAFGIFTHTDKQVGFYLEDMKINGGKLYLFTVQLHDVLHVVNKYYHLVLIMEMKHIILKYEELLETQMKGV